MKKVVVVHKSFNNEYNGVLKIKKIMTAIGPVNRNIYEEDAMEIYSFFLSMLPGGTHDALRNLYKKEKHSNG